MTVTVKPLSRMLAAWEDNPEEDPLYLPMEFDAATYESQPPSITNPELAPGEIAVGIFSAWCNRIELDYMATGGDGDIYVFYALPEGGTYPGDATFIVMDTAEASWTHAAEDLTPGNYTFFFGVVQESETPLYVHFDNVEILPGLVLTGEESRGNVVTIPTGELTLTGSGPTYLRGHHPPCGELTLTPGSFSWGQTGASVPLAELSITARNPAGIWSISADQLAGARVIYTCILTGDGDGLEDLAIPISSFQASMRDGDPSYLSCVLPSPADYEEEILDRTNGDIVVKKGYRLADGTEQMEEIARADYESLQIDEGAKSASATISGHKTVSSTAPKEWTVSGVSYYGLQADGKRRVRADLDLFLRPGDTCIYGTGANDYFVVGSITYWVSANPAGEFMEATEA